MRPGNDVLPTPGLEVRTKTSAVASISGRNSRGCVGRNCMLARRRSRASRARSACFDPPPITRKRRSGIDGQLRRRVHQQFRAMSVPDIARIHDDIPVIERVPPAEGVGSGKRRDGGGIDEIRDGDHFSPVNAPRRNGLRKRPRNHRDPVRRPGRCESSGRSWRA